MKVEPDPDFADTIHVTFDTGLRIPVVVDNSRNRMKVVNGPCNRKLMNLVWRSQPVGAWSLRSVNDYLVRQAHGQ